MLKIDERVSGRYRVSDLFPEGGQAYVAKGADEVMGTTVIIRQLRVSPRDPNYHAERARFERAARLRIGHSNVVDPVDAGEDDGVCYMILPFVEGPTLAKFVEARKGKVDHERATTIVRQTAGGLAACHDRGVTHRDVKPENILIDRDEEPRIIDFGISAVAGEPTITQGNGFQGSLLWAAPEQFFDPRARDFRLDQYALGAVYYFLLTGMMPTKGSCPEQVMRSTCNDTPPSPHELYPAIPKRISDACMRLLGKSPGDRFPSMRDFIRTIDARGGNGAIVQSCPSCGQEVAPLAQFCFRCGADTTISTSAGAATQCMACGAPLHDESACPKCLRIFSPADHRIEFIGGALCGRIFRIPMDLFVTGREILAPRDSHISRRHLRVACMNGDVMIEDAGSANKTFVDGRPLDQARTLKPNCEIVIAGNTGVYRKN